jgi:hypothetical protein
MTPRLQTLLGILLVTWLATGFAVLGQRLGWLESIADAGRISLRLSESPADSATDLKWLE